MSYMPLRDPPSSEIWKPILLTVFGVAFMVLVFAAPPRKPDTK
jgi:hypothetical protein